MGGPDVRPYQECGSEEAETNYPGNDIRTDSANTIDDCESLCETTNLCRGFVYNSIDKECYLKSALETSSSTAGYTAKRCSPGVSEIVQGNRDSVIILKEINKLSEQLDVIVQAVCQDEVPDYNCEECYCKAIGYWIYDSKTFLPDCDQTDNSFKPNSVTKAPAFALTSMASKFLARVLQREKLLWNAHRKETKPKKNVRKRRRHRPNSSRQNATPRATSNPSSV